VVILQIGQRIYGLCCEILAQKSKKMMEIYVVKKIDSDDDKVLRVYSDNLLVLPSKSPQKNEMAQKTYDDFVYRKKQLDTNRKKRGTVHYNIPLSSFEERMIQKNKKTGTKSLPKVSDSLDEKQLEQMKIAAEMNQKLKSSTSKPSFNDVYVNVEPLNNDERSRYNSNYINMCRRN
jgi:hypothetical protein